MAEPLTSWMESLIGEGRRFRKASNFAAEMGMTQTTWKRGFQGGAYSPENLFKLAKVTGESPLRILRLAGRDELATVIVDAFGPPREVESPAVERLLQALHSVQQPERDQIADAMLVQMTAMRRALQSERTDSPNNEVTPGRHPARTETSRKRGGRSRGELKAG